METAIPSQSLLSAFFGSMIVTVGASVVSLPQRIRHVTRRSTLALHLSASSRTKSGRRKTQKKSWGTRVFRRRCGHAQKNYGDGAAQKGDNQDAEMIANHIMPRLFALRLYEQYGDIRDSGTKAFRF